MASESLAGLEFPAEGIAVLRLRRPEKRNALSRPLLRDLAASIGELACAFPTVRAVIVTGNGPSFCAGADIREFDDWDAQSLHDFIALGSHVFANLQHLPQTVIAAVHGHVLGGGLELALACDLIVADDTAILGFPEVTIGGVPGWGGTMRIQERVGRAWANYLVLTGETIGADFAATVGLVNEVVRPQLLLTRATAIATRIAGLSPTALRLAKQALLQASPYLPMRHEAVEQYSNLACMLSEDRRASIQSFFGKSTPAVRQVSDSPPPPNV